MRLHKYLSLIVAFFMLVSSSGLAFNVHFCGDKIAAISSIFSNEEVCVKPIHEEKTCCATVENNHKKCCSDKKISHDDDSEKIVIKLFSFDLDSVFIIQTSKADLFSKVISHTFIQDFDYSYDAIGPALFKLYSQFIFYESIYYS